MRHPPEGPPICTALNAASPLMPPPISKITSFSVVPIGTSISPVCFTLPVSANAFVPGLFSGPMLLNQSAPSIMIIGTLANVSTLFNTVGFPNNPCSTVLGGFTLGIPLFPSMDAVRALPSPQTNAPAPRLICSRNEKSVPRILSPSRPHSSAWEIASFRRLTASGYSART